MRKYLYLLTILLLIPTYGFATDGVSGVEHPAKVNSVVTPDKVCGVEGLAAAGGGASESDNFNRSNESPLGGNWETIDASGLNLVSNAVTSGSGSSTHEASAWRESTTNFADDQKASLKITTRSDWDHVGVVVRATSVGPDYYTLHTFEDGTQWQMGKVDNGSFTPLAQGSGVSAGETITLEVVTSGSDAILTAKEGGVELTESWGTNPYTDSSPLTGGQPGVYYFEDNVGGSIGDDWAAEDL